MLLFKPYHVKLILTGRKIQSRRFWKKPHCKVGSVHQCRTKMLDKSSTFALVRILEVKKQRLYEMTDRDVFEEGYDSKIEYFNALARINNIHQDTPDFTNLEPYAIRFKLVSEEELPNLDNQFADDEFVDSLESMIQRGEDCD